MTKEEALKMAFQFSMVKIINYVESLGYINPCIELTLEKSDGVRYKMVLERVDINEKGDNV